MSGSLRYVLVTSVIVAIVLGFGLRYASSFGDAYQASRLEELDRALNEAITLGARTLRLTVLRSREPGVALPCGAASFTMERSVSESLQRAERLELVDGEEEKALAVYLAIILDTEDPSELVAASRNAARIQARRGAVAEARATLERTLAITGASAQERQLASEALASYRRGDPVPETTGDRGAHHLPAAVARVLAAADAEQVVRFDDARVAWGLEITGARPRIAVAPARDVLAAALPGFEAGRWTLTDAVAGRLLPPPFPLLRVGPQPSEIDAIGDAAATQRLWHASPAVLAALLLAGGAGLAWSAWRRRERDERRKNAFVCAVTHELMTPIANISLYAETLREHGRDDPDSVPGFATVVLDEAERLRQRVREVLDVASGRRTLPATDGAFDPRPIVEDVLHEYEDRFRPAGMHCVLTVDAHCGSVRGTAALFRRALEGVLDNAAKFARGGALGVGLRRDGATVLLEIDDEGPGIPVGERERVFQPFVRLDADLDHAAPGTGLGLTLVRSCIEECGGAVTIEEGRRGGTRVCVRLPAEAHHE